MKTRKCRSVILNDYLHYRTGLTWIPSNDWWAREGFNDCSDQLPRCFNLGSAHEELYLNVSYVSVEFIVALEFIVWSILHWPGKKKIHILSFSGLRHGHSLYSRLLCQLYTEHLNILLRCPWNKSHIITFMVNYAAVAKLLLVLVVRVCSGY